MKEVEQRLETRGRPSKKPKGSFFRSTLKYLKITQDVYWEGVLVEINLPSVEGLAQYFGVHRDTLYEWAKSDSEIKLGMGQVKSEQEQRLIESGLNWRYRASFVSLLLRTNHGYGLRKKIRNQKSEILEFVRRVYEDADLEIEKMREDRILT